MRPEPFRCPGQLSQKVRHPEEDSAARGPGCQRCHRIADGKEVSGARLARKANYRQSYRVGRYQPSYSIHLQGGAKN